MSADREKLAALFAAKSDGTISDADHALLETLLSESAEARALWFVHCDIETGLADWAAERNARKESLPTAQAVRRKTKGALSWLAAAAAVVVALFLWPRGARVPAGLEVKASGVAVLGRAVDVEWLGAPQSAGAVLEAGTLRLKSGAAMVEFFSGARVIVEGPAELELVSSVEASLRSGKLSAHVPPQAHGFVVNSPGMRLVDLGTDFGIRIAPDAAPEVHVFTGKVEVAAAAAAPKPLIAGEAARITGAALQPIAPAKDAFISENELARLETESAGKRFARWQEASARLGAKAVVHYTFEDADAPRQALNGAPGATGLSHGSIVGCDRAEGRWPGKSALRFRSEGDRVRLIAPDALEAVTLIAWLRVDALPHWQNALLSADGELPGTLHWHITREGELRLEIARDLGRTHADWEAVNSAPFATTAAMGRWMMLATTFDGKTIRHYGDGRAIGSGASFTPPAIRIGAAELANWRGDTRRNLPATMDEFLVLPRALSPEEIAAYYESGR